MNTGRLPLIASSLDMNLELAAIHVKVKLWKLKSWLMRDDCT